MAEVLLPPMEGVLGRPNAGPPRAWQRALRDLALPEGLLGLAWSLSGVPIGLAPDRRRDLAALLLSVLVNETQGSTCLPTDDLDLRLRLARSLGLGDLSFEVLEDPALAAFVSQGEGKGPLVMKGGKLSSLRLFRSEQSLAEGMRKLAAPEPGGATVPEAVLLDPVTLSSEQRRAVTVATSAQLALITGGPGTGKTSIIVAILRAVLALGMSPGDLALAAPTGKAANRMAEAIHGARGRIRQALPTDEALIDQALLPQTLHRLLGFLPSEGHFRHHAANPLKARLVIVDESSMIDAVLMDRLVQSLHPEARLVLIGDADQLPSVDAGTVFRDLVSGLPARTVRLSHSYRMDESTSGGAAILTVAQRVNGGGIEASSGDLAPLTLRTRLEDVEGVGVELLDPDHRTLQDFLDQWLETLEDQAGFRAGIQHVFRLGAEGWSEGDVTLLTTLFAQMDRVRLLCPVREAPHLRGCVGINAYLHERALDARDPGLEKRLAFSRGEPVMMTRNNYALGIFNGDQGLILLVARGGGEPRLEAVFPTRDGFRAFTVGPLLGDLELAYALTVHKAQGSEFDRVVLILPDGDSPLATREVLYTALTRARKAVTILGSREAMAQAADRTIQRHSRLGGLRLMD